VLFVFSLILLPVFWFFKTTFGARILRWIGNVLAVPGVVYLLALPLIPLVNISEDVVWGMQDFGGWNLTSYLWLLFIGFVLFSHERLLERVRQFRWVSLALALVVGGVGFVLLALRINPTGTLGGFGAFLIEEHTDLGCWMWLLTLIGFAMQYLNFRTRFVDYGNEGVLPFYILHQPVLLTVGLFVIPLAIPALLKWAIIMPVSFVIIMVLYEFVVRRFNVVRVLFGMKVVRRAAPVAAVRQPEAA
jgi:glucan biosynthesis protein C